MAAHMCTEQIMDIRHTLCYLVVLFREKYFMFGDNDLVINSASAPHANLHKRHIVLSFHRVREAITAGVISFRYLSGKDSPHRYSLQTLGLSTSMELLKPTPFRREDTMCLISIQYNKEVKDGKTCNSPVFNIHGE